MSRFLLLFGGDLLVTPRLLRQVEGAQVIAADSGIRHASSLGVVPHLWVGDFDSAGAEHLAAYADLPRKTFPAAKDRTDGELAAAEAVALGASELVIAGAFGGARPDHAFLHLTLGIRLAAGGLPVTLTSGREEGHPLLAGTGWRAFDYPPGTLFSILGFSTLSGLFIEGAVWPLHDVTMPFGSSLTISNEVAEGPLRVSLETGRALLLAYPPFVVSKG